MDDTIDRGIERRESEYTTAELVGPIITGIAGGGMLSIATLGCWCPGTDAVFTVMTGAGVDGSVAMLTFVELGRGGAPFSLAALILGWTGCILLDFISAVGIALCYPR